MKIGSDRVFGAITFLSAAAVALEARTFEVGFYSDPLGASGLPLIAASLLGIGGAFLFFRPKATASWPDRSTLVRFLAVTVSLFVYAAVLPVLGFLVSTALVVSVFSVVFGGPIKWSVILASTYTVVLYVLFFYVLGLRLPIGSLFLRAP